MATILSISFPFRQGVSSFPEPATDADAVRSSILQILMTPLGTRVMRPNFGSQLLKFLFENDSQSTSAGIEREVRTALGRWEPRIVVEAVQIESGNSLNEPGQILVTVFYTIVSNGVTASVTIGGI